MKFYNPFKWHIFKTTNGQYYVSKQGLFCKYYLDLSDGYVWSNHTKAYIRCFTKPYTRYCFGTYEQAKKQLIFVQKGSFVE